MFACIGARENSARRGTGSEKKLAQVLVLALVCAVVVAFGLLGTDIFQGSFPGEIPDGIARIVTVFFGEFVDGSTARGRNLGTVVWIVKNRCFARARAWWKV